MATMGQNVIEETMIERLRREMRGGPDVSNIAQEVTSTAQDVAAYATAPVTEIFYDARVAGAFALGTLFGASLIIITLKLFGL